jgi:hypothetical protein
LASDRKMATFSTMEGIVFIGVLSLCISSSLR